jgi:uncharacterized lipoprotein YajG
MSDFLFAGGTLMKQLLFAVVALLTLCGCQAAQQRHFATDKQYCQSIGATGDTFSQCMMSRDQQRQQRYQSMLQAGAQINSLSQPRPITTTTCFRTGDTVTCHAN